jgi:diguanylate cyclase (GGDEF)-like protein
MAMFLLTIAFALLAAIGGAMWAALADRERRLVEQAITDPLTGAFNRRHMAFCLDQAVARRRRTGEPASLLFIDIDYFKRVNDRWGHSEGDAALKRLVTLVASRGRRLDVLFRLGGEEFVLLLPATPYAGAVIVAEAIRESVAAAVLLPDGERLSVSIGVTELRASQSAAAWLDDGDAAVYRAKESGRNRVSASDGFVLKPARVM